MFAVTRDTFKSAVIDDRDGSLQRRARNYERLCSRAPLARAGGRDRDRRHAFSVRFCSAAWPKRCVLHRACTRRWTVFLAGFPLEMLVCPRESEPLGATREMVRVPSAAFLAYLRARPDPPVAASAVLAVASNTTELAGARAEVDHLAARYGATRVLAPARNEFLADLAGYDVIHIASHVHVDGERPWNSGILIGARTPVARGRRMLDSTTPQTAGLVGGGITTGGGAFSGGAVRAAHPRLPAVARGRGSSCCRHVSPRWAAPPWPKVCSALRRRS
jgi:hypothetical protein